MSARLISILFLLFATHSIIYSQDIYRINYRSPQPKDTATFNAFFSISPNGTGFIRVNPVSDNYTVEMDITESYTPGKDGNPDLTHVFYEGKNPRVVKGNGKTNFTPVKFWFKITPDNFYDPWGVTSVAVNSAPSQQNLSFEYIESKDLVGKEVFVKSFFADTSMYYKTIFSPKSKGGFLTAAEKKKTHLYLIAVASTYDKSLQPNCLNDALNFIDFFSRVVNKLDIPLSNFIVDTVFGSRYSRASVEAALKKIRPTPDDLVIFYYSGHGFHNKKTPEKSFPYFDLRDPTKPKKLDSLKTQTLNVQDIYKTIVDKGARFNLVISDCCNDTVVVPKRKWWEPTKKKGIANVEIKNLRNLFMSKQQVNYLMTAASINEQAIITPSLNSYFTYFFLQSLSTYLSQPKQFPTWPQVFNDTKNLTNKHVKGLPCNEPKCPEQNPIIFPTIKL